MGLIKVSTNTKTEFIDITAEVQGQIESSQIKDGLALIYVPHTTAGVTVNEHADPAVVADINNKLEELAPQSGKYLHSEGNSDGHIKSALVGSSQAIPINGGKLQLGTWQGVFFCEFDGPRSRSCYVKIISTM